MTTAEIAAVARISPSWLTRCVRDVTGMPLHAHVRERRLQAALRLLRPTVLTVGTIALDCGFHDHAHLTRALRTRFGVPPSIARGRDGWPTSAHAGLQDRAEISPRRILGVHLRLSQRGSLGPEMLEVRQPAIETNDPASTHITFVTSIEPWRAVEMDFGDGWVRHEGGGVTVDIQPAGVEYRFRLPAMHLRTASVSVDRLAALLDANGLPPRHARLDVECHAPDPVSAQLGSAIWHASSAPDAGRNLLLDGLFLQLFGLVPALARPERMFGLCLPLANVRLSRAIDYVEAYLAGPFTVAELAAVAVMGERAFSVALPARVLGPCPAPHH